MAGVRAAKQGCGRRRARAALPLRGARDAFLPGAALRDGEGGSSPHLHPCSPREEQTRREDGSEAPGWHQAAPGCPDSPKCTGTSPPQPWAPAGTPLLPLASQNPSFIAPCASRAHTLGANVGWGG